MSDQFNNQIYDNLNLKETDELVDIWTQNNRAEWTDTAFEIIEEILMERMGELPPQSALSFSRLKRVIDRSVEEQDKEENLLERISDPENTSVLYEPAEVLKIVYWLRWIATAALVITGFLTLTELPDQMESLSRFLSIDDFSGALTILLIFVYSIIVRGFLPFFVLRAFASALEILMEMEFNSRSTG